jgi:hypothetical protein
LLAAAAPLPSGGLQLLRVAASSRSHTPPYIHSAYLTGRGRHCALSAEFGSTMPPRPDKHTHTSTQSHPVTHTSTQSHACAYLPHREGRAHQGRRRKLMRSTANGKVGTGGRCIHTPLPVRYTIQLQRVSYREGCGGRCIHTPLPVSYPMYIYGVRLTGRGGCIHTPLPVRYTI